MISKMDINEQIELLADVWKDQVDNSMNKNIGDLLENKVEVRSVNFSIEQKLDKIIATSEDIAKTNKEYLGVLKELLEKLNKEEVSINSSVSVSSEKGSNVDISKHLYELANKVERREVTDKPKTNYSLDIYLGLMDDKGNVISKQHLYKQENGDIVCEPMIDSRTIVDWSLNRDNCQVFKQVYKESVATKTKPKTMVKVGIIGEDGVLEFHRPNSFEIPNSPSVYSRDWFIEDNDSTKEVLKFKSISSPVTWCTEIATKIGTPNVENKYLKDYNVTGYITDDGRAVYYDQYI